MGIIQPKLFKKRFYVIFVLFHILDNTLNDGSLATCTDMITPDIHLTGVFKRIITRHVIVTLIGHDLNCSPVDGVRVQVENEADYICPGDSCSPHMMCTAHAPRITRDGLTMCKNKCDNNAENAVVYISSIEPTKICEVLISLP